MEDSGLFEMASDPVAGPRLLRYKYEIGTLTEPVSRRFEVVEPATPAVFRRVVAALAPEADPDRLRVTPYFDRNRVKTHVYLHGSRSVYEVFADHSEFLGSGHRSFDQVEIEYVGVIDRADRVVACGRDGGGHLDAGFETVREAVVTAFAARGIPLTPSRRRKYDWAVAEFFCPDTWQRSPRLPPGTPRRPASAAYRPVPPRPWGRASAPRLMQLSRQAVGCALPHRARRTWAQSPASGPGSFRCGTGPGAVSIRCTSVHAMPKQSSGPKQVARAAASSDVTGREIAVS
ncbi:hypothetical protein [Streptomyces erythrochromogenes]|uniref:hypothetical protein n=1 Tax=Streptomyces erythrochromogenes TaxID=285574 RepID=UPI0036BEED28